MLARFQRWTLSFALAWLVVAPPAALAAGWYDSFNDGNAGDGSPVTWGTTPLPGVYSATTGDYLLSAPGDSDGPTGSAIDDNSLIASVDVQFTDTYVRTQALVLPGPNEGEVGGTLGVFARYNAATVSGYAAILSNGFDLQLLKVTGGVAAELASIDPGVDTAADALIQLDVIGDLLSVYVWRPGTAKPVDPVMTFNDSTFTSGRAGIVYNENDDNTIGVFRFATAQDTPLADLVSGDYDLDRDVDGADFLLWQRDFGSTTNLAADGNGDLVVDGADLDVWKTSFGPGAMAAIAAVPEPSSLALLTAAALGAFLRKRR
jgi:hypothetical protein